MKRILASFVLALALAGRVQAVDYTITLTPEQDIILQWAAAQPNPPEQPTAVRPRVLLQSIVDSALRSLAVNRNAIKGTALFQYFKSLTSAEQLQACTDLKLPSEYCTAP